METKENDFLAYMKYEGEAIDSGYMDARKSAEALIGMDEVIRFFLYQEDPELQTIEFEIPVRIRKGSWEALIPQNIEEWIRTAIGIGITTYSTTALKKLAENDFKDKKLKDIFISAIKGIKWVIKIATHIGSMTKKKIENVTFKENNTIIGIQNDNGETLLIPLKYFKFYTNCPEKLFSKITNIIEEKRELVIGINKNEVTELEDLTDTKVTITQKFIFTHKEEDLDEILFPELVHNQYIELEGHVTRGNENSNTIGFEYKDHILTCYPTQGNITQYKNLLFTNCLIKGYVDRLDREGNINERRPRLKFIELLPNQKDNNSLNLFSDT